MTPTSPVEPTTEARRPSRHDPRHRHADGLAGPGTKLMNQDEGRIYALVYKADQMQGMEYYEYLGYEVEKSRKGGPRLAVGRTSKPGQPIEFMGHVLMSIDKETYSDINKYGAFGSGGQLAADKLEAHIVDKDGGPDPIRGIRNRFMRVENEIEPTRTVETQ